MPNFPARHDIAFIRDAQFGERGRIEQQLQPFPRGALAERGRAAA
jgi:hypothetical protein